MTDYIPPKTEIHQQINVNEFQFHPNTAQYKGADYSNALRVERGISIEKAFAIAKNDPQIGYFVFVKGRQMVLEVPAECAFDPLGLITLYDAGGTNFGPCRIFQKGDAVFFKKEGMWLGSAPGLADTYVKE